MNSISSTEVTHIGFAEDKEKYEKYKYTILAVIIAMGVVALGIVYSKIKSNSNSKSTSNNTEIFPKKSRFDWVAAKR